VECVRPVSLAPTSPRWAIDEVHLCELGLMVLENTALDEKTAVEVLSRLEGLRATSGLGPVRRSRVSQECG